MSILKGAFSIFLLAVMSFGTLVAVSLPAKADFDCMIACVDSYNSCMLPKRIFCRITSPLNVQACLRLAREGCLQRQQQCRRNCEFPCPT